MTRPATLPTHDTNGTLLTTPPSGILTDGYQALDKPAAGWFNWLFYWITQWIDWLQDTYPTYSTLEDAYAGTAEGDRCIVYENDKDKALPSADFDTGGTAATAVSAVAVSGTHVFYAHGAANPVKVARADLGTVVTTYTRTNAGSVVKLIFYSDATREYIAAAYGNYVEAWNAETGASVWVYDHGGTVRDLAYQFNRLCLVGNSGTGTKYARGLNAGTGSALWSYNHGGNLLAVTAIPGAFVVAGAASSHASGANMRAIAVTTGNDAANEGGTAADTSGVAWDIVQTNASSARTLAGDRTGLWWLDATAKTVYCLDPTAGTTLLSYVIDAAYTPYELSVDQDMILFGVDAGGGAGFAYSLDKRTLQPRFRFRASTGAVQRVVSDGAALYLAQLAVSSGGGLTRFYRGNRPTVFLRPRLQTGEELYTLNPGRIMPDMD